MSSVTWKKAWYPVTGEYIDVHKALRVRDRNSGEYRENPCYHDRFSYENGCGISLFPRKEGKDGTVPHFARYSDKENEKAARNLSDSIGMPSTAIYLNNALRVSTMIRNIGIALTKNLIEVMNVESYENKQESKKNSMRSDFTLIVRISANNSSTEEISLFIKEKGRSPDIVETGTNNWILDITKWETEVVTDWSKAEPLFLQKWRNFIREFQIEKNEASEKSFVSDEPEKKVSLVVYGNDLKGAFESVFSSPETKKLRGKSGTMTVHVKDKRNSFFMKHHDLSMKTYHESWINEFTITDWSSMACGSQILFGVREDRFYARKTKLKFYAETIERPNYTLPSLTREQFGWDHFEHEKSVWPDPVKFEKAWHCYKNQDFEGYRNACTDGSNGFSPKCRLEIKVRWKKLRQNLDYIWDSDFKVFNDDESVKIFSSVNTDFSGVHS